MDSCSLILVHWFLFIETCSLILVHWNVFIDSCSLILVHWFLFNDSCSMILAHWFLLIGSCGSWAGHWNVKQAIGTCSFTLVHSFFCCFTQTCTHISYRHWRIEEHVFNFCGNFDHCSCRIRIQNWGDLSEVSAKTKSLYVTPFASEFMYSIGTDIFWIPGISINQIQTHVMLQLSKSSRIGKTNIVLRSREFHTSINVHQWRKVWHCIGFDWWSTGQYRVRHQR